MSRRVAVDLGALTVDDFAGDQAALLARLRDAAPVAWVPALGAWLVTSHDLAFAIMRDPVRFTVDDPRFSTRVVLGENMLSLDGAAHGVRRDRFAPHFRPTRVRGDAELWLAAESKRLMASCVASGRSELRSDVAAPLAVSTIIEFLGLGDVVEANALLGWYRELLDAIDIVSTGGEAGAGAIDAMAHIGAAIGAADPTASLVGQVRGEGVPFAELVSDVAVTLFGAIETSEGMTSTALWHLLTGTAGALEAVSTDRALVVVAIEESLRLDPAAAVVDRYATADVEVGGAAIRAGDLVRVSLSAANRDPAVFADPDEFRLDRPNPRQQLAFATGPHACLGVHLARAETAAAVNAFLDVGGRARFDQPASSGPRGLIFRKPEAIWVDWR